MRLRLAQRYWTVYTVHDLYREWSTFFTCSVKLFMWCVEASASALWWIMVMRRKLRFRKRGMGMEKQGGSWQGEVVLDLWGRVVRAHREEGGGWWGTGGILVSWVTPSLFRYYNNAILWAAPLCAFSAGLWMGTLHESARCHGLKQGSPFMHWLWFPLIRQWASGLFNCCLCVCAYMLVHSFL